MRLSTYSLIVWLLVIGLQATCVYVLLRKKLRNQLTLFYTYLVFQTFKEVVLLSIYHWGTYAPYFYAYWAGNAVMDMCAFLVLHEIFCATFQPFAGLRDMAQVIFRWAAVAMLLVAFVVFSSSTLPGSQKIVMIVMNMQKSIRVMQCGLLLFMLMGAHYLGLTFKHRLFGLSLGFGLSASLELLANTLFQVSGYRPGLWLNYMSNGATIATLGIFLFYLLKPEPERGLVSIPVSSPLLRWNEAALAVSNGGQRRAAMAFAEPFMPSVERMVEQIMHRDMPPGGGRSN